MTNTKSLSRVNPAAGFPKRSHSNARLRASPDRRDERFENGRQVEYADPPARMSGLSILQVTSRAGKGMKESEKCVSFLPGYLNYSSLHFVITLRNSLKSVLKCARRKDHQTKNTYGGQGQTRD